jgi:hypothetical protein
MSDELVEVGRFASAEEAAVAQGVLDAAGIRTSLEGEAMAGWFWHLGEAISGVRLVVLADDVEQAREIMASLAGLQSGGKSELEEMFPDSRDDDLELPDLDHATELTRAWRASVIGIALLPPLLNLYSMWILLRHGLLLGRDSRRVSRRAVAAAAINLTILSIAGLLIMLMFHEPNSVSEDEVNHIYIEGHIVIPIVPYETARIESVIQHDDSNEQSTSPTSPHQPEPAPGGQTGPETRDVE